LTDHLQSAVLLVIMLILHHMRVITTYHRRLKLRTDGGQSRVHELGSIDLFVVTSLKMNQLSPNFEHKFPIMYGILAANYFAI